MRKASKRVVINSERLNNYGFGVTTSGIDLTAFASNPLMLWMHKRNEGRKDDVLPLGYIEDVRLEQDAELGEVLTGLPVFDDTDDFALSIFNKYENGTIKMASAGLIPLEWTEQNGVRRLSKSILQEVSIVDIGANPDALQVALYDPATMVQLALSATTINEFFKSNNMNKIELTAEQASVLLGVSNLNDSADFTMKVSEVVQLAARQKTQIESLTKDKSDLEAKVNAMEAAEKAAEVNTYLSAKLAEGRITEAEKAGFVKLAATDFETVKTMVDARPTHTSIKVQLADAAGVRATGYEGKSYDDLDKSGKLIQLKADNLPLFKELFKAKFNAEYKD